MVSIEGRRATPIEEAEKVIPDEKDIPGYHEQSALKHAFVDLYLASCTNLELEREDNLDCVQGLQERGGKIIFIGNHRSMIDAPVLERTMEINGFKDISDELVFLLGPRVKKNPGTKFLSDAFAHIDVWQQNLIPEGEEIQRARTIRKNSIRAVPLLLERGKVITIFAEGTRSRNGELGEFASEIGHFAKSPDTFIVPFGLIGTQNIWPIDKRAPKVIKKENARVIIGEPFKAADYMQGSERYATVMNHARECVDELIPPEDKIPY